MGRMVRENRWLAGNGRKHRCMLLFLLIFTVMGASRVLAAKSGWVQSGGKIYYYLTEETADGGTASAKAKGLQKIGGKFFYFNTKGVMQTGWQETEDGFRYFRTTGAAGTRGAMYKGFQSIGQYKFYFDKKTGIVKTGFTKLTKNTYFFSTSKKLGTRGRSVLNTWKTVKGEKYYFGSDGAMVKDGWVEQTWYVDPEGKMLKNTVTPDGYLVGEDGKKFSNTKINGWVRISGQWHYYIASEKTFLTSSWKTINGNKFYLDEDGIRVSGLRTIGKFKYYFNKNGVMQTGLQTVKGKQYYFNDTSGRMLKNTKVGPYLIDEEGVVTRDPDAHPRVLIIAGHGQGDSGAVSSWGQEQNFTRQFARLIYDELAADDRVDVDFYKNGSTSFDCYQQNVKTFGSTGLNISSKITGKGTIKKKVKSGLAKNGNLPDFTEYDYVLEVHFNAKGTGKDPGGNGSYTGIGFYINSYKTEYRLENNILNRIVGLGFQKWGSGIFKSSTLFNCRICQELGVSYGLLETAFIDDGDDMRFYTNNKKKMAKAVAEEIAKYIG